MAMQENTSIEEARRWIGEWRERGHEDDGHGTVVGPGMGPLILQQLAYLEDMHHEAGFERWNVLNPDTPLPLLTCALTTSACHPHTVRLWSHFNRKWIYLWALAS